jgi:hypothetical protein
MKRKYIETSNKNSNFKSSENSNSSEKKPGEHLFETIVDELTGMTLEIFLVLDQIHDFGQNDDRNMLYRENDPEKLHLKFAKALIEHHWKRISIKYKNLKNEQLYKHLFGGSINLDKLVEVKSSKYKVSRTIVEHFHKIAPTNLLDLHTDINNWKASDAVDLFEKFLVDLNVTRLYVDCNKSKYNLYPILHSICNNSFNNDNDNDNILTPNLTPKIEVIKTVASVYDPAVSNSVEAYVKKIQEIHPNNNVKVVEHYSIAKKNYMVKTTSGKVIADFSFEYDKHWKIYDLFKTPDEYLQFYNCDCKRKIQKSFVKQFPKDIFSVTQRDFNSEPQKHVSELRKKLGKLGKHKPVKNTILNTFRVRANINSFLDETEFGTWNTPNKPFKNVSVRNVSNYVLNKKDEPKVFNAFAYKTLGDFAQVLEAKEGNGVFITADDQCAYISSLLTPTLFERDNDHVLCSLIYYGTQILTSLKQHKRIKLK